MSFWLTECKIFRDIMLQVSAQYNLNKTLKYNITGMTTAICNVSVSSFQVAMPCYAPCHLMVLSVLVFLIRGNERDKLSSLSAMKGAFLRLQVRKMKQTKLEEYFNVLSNHVTSLEK